MKKVSIPREETLASLRSDLARLQDTLEAIRNPRLRPSIIKDIKEDITEIETEIAERMARRNK